MTIIVAFSATDASTQRFVLNQPQAGGGAKPACCVRAALLCPLHRPAAQPDAADPFLSRPSTGCSNQIELGIRPDGAANPTYGLHRGCGAANVASNAVPTAQWVVMSFVALATGTLPANTLVYKNGVSLTVTTGANGGWLSAGSYPTGAFAIYIGVRNDGGGGSLGSYFQGIMGDIVILRSSSSYWRTVAEQELMAKYGITGGAPSAEAAGALSRPTRAPPRH